MKLTVEQLQHVLDTYDKGVLSKGAHEAEEGAYCALEAVSLARNGGRQNFTDNPDILGMPDLRPLNDASWSSDKVRTTTMLPLLAALSDWSEWSQSRQTHWTSLVVIHTVNRIIAYMPQISVQAQEQCKQAKTLDMAACATYAAGADAAYAAAHAARAAARAARADAAARAARADAAADAAARAAAEAARAAADAAADAAYAAAEAAHAAARAARAAADAGADAAADAMLFITCAIWLEAVELSKEK